VYLDGLIAVGEYRGILGKLIKRLKYSHQFDVTQTAVKLMSQKMPQYKGNNLILVPVPLHAKKLKIRGYNQSELLAFGIASKLELRSINLLVKIKATAPQAGLNRNERLQNLLGVFALKNPKLKYSKIPAIIIIDDVVTTSTTLNECAKILKNAGVKQVFGLALAHGK
jgi:ComF family protein